MDGQWTASGECAAPALLPDRRRLLAYLGYVLAVDVLFVVVYGGCNWLTTQRAARVPLHFEWELGIPFVPAMIWPYLSIVLLFVLPLFVLDVAALRRLAARMAWAIAISGACFLVLPAQPGWSRPADAGAHGPLFALLYRFDGPYNLAPSLHVAFSALLLSALAARASRPARWLCAAWMALIAAAVVLVHQHHLIDVLGGLGVALLSSRLVPGPSGVVP
jgi:membrane-associated phospholipid phosphatase